MTARTLPLAAGLLVVVCGAGAQTPPPLPAGPFVPGPMSTGSVVPNPPAVVPNPPSIPDVVGPALPGTGSGARVHPGLPQSPLAPVIVPVPLPPAEKSVEQLILELESVQLEKAALLKKEHLLKVTIGKKLADLQDRVNKIEGGKLKGVGDAAGPNRVGRVFVEGFSEKDEKKVSEVVEKAGLLPGQVLRYPAIEDARGRLERIGFKGAEVLEVPNESPSVFRDIRVRSAQPVER